MSDSTTVEIANDARPAAVVHPDVDIFGGFLNRGIPGPVINATRDWNREYCRMFDPAGLHMIQAETGGYKSTLLCNVAVALALRKRKAAIICCQMDADVMQLWMLAVVSNIPADEVKRIDATGDPDGRLKPFQVFLGQYVTIQQTNNFTPDVLLVTVAKFAKEGYTHILIDGADSVFAHFDESKRTQIERVLSQLAGVANIGDGISICLNSQIKATARHQEVVTCEDSSESAAKSTEAYTVVSLSKRIDMRLQTLAINKSRSHEVSDFNAVTRFTVNPSRRLEPLQGGQHLDQQSLYPTDIRTPTYINNLPGDLPGDEPADICKNDENPTAPLRLLTGSGVRNGFVQIDYKIFDLLMYANGNFEALGFLFDLYGMAQFKSGNKMYAPRTSVPVHLERGEVLVSNGILAKRWNKSPNFVRDFLARAEREGAFTSSLIDSSGARKPSKHTSKDAASRSLGTIVTLCHYVPLRGTASMAGSKKKSVDESDNGHVEDASRNRQGIVEDASRTH